MIDYQAIADRVKREFACAHPDVATTYLIAVNNVRHYRMQCRRCGRNLGAVRYSDITPDEREAATEFDEALSREWNESQCERSRQLHALAAADEKREFDEWYSGYLLTPEWRRRRSAILKRDGGVCRGCLARPATQVHHVTYERVGEEMAFDLVAVCDACHTKIHEAKRAGATS